MTTRGGAGHVSGVTPKIGRTAVSPVLTWCGAGPEWCVAVGIADHGRIVVGGSHESPLAVSELRASCATVMARTVASRTTGLAYGRAPSGAAGSARAIGGVV